MTTFFLVFHVIMAFMIIGLILIQHGKGAEAGAAFGGGASNTVFGSQGAGSFLSRATIVLAILFAITSFSLTKFSYKRSRPNVVDVKQLVLPGDKDHEDNATDKNQIGNINKIDATVIAPELPSSDDIPN